MRDHIQKLILSISPGDALEESHKHDAASWIDSGVEIFRIAKPADPPKHLVAYFVLIDVSRQKVLLMDHINAELWLPSGGHVELYEDPRVTVEREIVEELHQEAVFIEEDPFFITQSVTVGKTAGHTDVSLWYLLHGDSSREIDYDKGEFYGYKWFNFDEVLETPSEKLDPHMHRFMKKYLTRK